MSLAKPIHTVVLDTAPILQNIPAVSTLLSQSESIVTPPSVVSEIKDVNARRLFDTTLQPFLNIKPPSLLSIRFVTDFARKTGDLAVLSKTDIDVIALAYELDCNRNGGDSRLRKAPGRKGPNGSQRDCILDPPEVSEATPVKMERTQAFEPTTAAPWAKNIPQSNYNVAPLENIKPRGQSGNQSEHPEAPAHGIFGLQNDLGTRDALNVSGSMIDCNHKEPLLEKGTSPPETEDSASEDSEAWITPSNIRKFQAAAKNSCTSAITPEATVQVAIITTDFAMQNVILQIGLTLLSPTLQCIRNIRTYILRCHACFQKVKDMSKQFCPCCGKPTLTRVSCSTNAKGEFKIHLKKNMQWNHRGDRYSIPNPVSGRANGKVGKGKGGGKGGWGQGLILAEDQKEYQRALGLSAKAKGIDFMDEDYLPGILSGERGRAGGMPKVGAGRNVNAKKRAQKNIR